MMFQCYGNYEINKGEYVFALKEFINKKFTLNKGEITWLRPLQRKG